MVYSKKIVVGDCHRTNMKHKIEPIFCFEYGVYNGVIAITPYKSFYLQIKISFILIIEFFDLMQDSHIYDNHVFHQIELIAILNSLVVHQSIFDLYAYPFV